MSKEGSRGRISVEELERLMDEVIPKDSYLASSDGYDGQIYWNREKKRFESEGWDDYNDDMGYRRWDLDKVKRVEVKGWEIVLESERDVRMNDERKVGERWSYYLRFKVYVPCRNLGLMMKR